MSSDKLKHFSLSPVLAILLMLCWHQGLAQTMLSEQETAADFLRIAGEEFETRGIVLSAEGEQALKEVIDAGVERLAEAGATAENTERSRESLRKLVEWIAMERLTIPQDYVFVTVEDLLDWEVVKDGRTVGEVESVVSGDGGAYIFVSHLNGDNSGKDDLFAPVDHLA